MLKKVWFMFVLWSVLMVTGCSGDIPKDNTDSVAVTADVVAVDNSATSVGTEQTETSETNVVNLSREMLSFQHIPA